jgi:uncharacterized protein
MVAIFDLQDEHHAHYVGLLSREPAGWQLYSTWPCIVEASHLLNSAASRALLRWVASGALQVFPFGAEHLLPMVETMETHSEPRRTRMDFADASLWWVAHKTGVHQVMTIDERDFLRYRLPDGRAFNIL